MSKSILTPSSKVIKSKCFDTYIHNDSICVTIVNSQSEILLADAQENTMVVRELSDGNLYPLLVDSRLVKSINKEARDHFSMRNRKMEVSAIAILISSPVSIIIGNFFMGLNKPVVPTKLFKDEDKAIKWLKKITKS